MTASKASKRKDKKPGKTQGLAKILAGVKASNAKKVLDAMDEDVEDEAEGSAKTGSAKTVLPTKDAAKDKAPPSAAVSATKGAAKDNVAPRAAASATNGAAKKDVASKPLARATRCTRGGVRSAGGSLVVSVAWPLTTRAIVSQCTIECLRICCGEQHVSLTR